MISDFKVHKKKWMKIKYFKLKRYKIIMMIINNYEIITSKNL